MDLNLKWEASKWVITNLPDIAFWLLLIRYIANSILTNVPEAKSNTGFEAICNVINSLYAGAKSLMPGKQPAGQEPAKEG